MYTKLVRIGNSRGVRLPKAVIDQAHLEEDLDICPHCGQVIKIISFITHKTLIQKILGHLGLPTETPTTAPARSPPQVEMHFAQRHRNSDRTGDLAGDGNLFDQTHWPNCP